MRKKDIIDVDERPICKEYQKEYSLYSATANCDGRIFDNFYGGGGVKCTKCSGWFCY
jgi:hypothetical protein